MSKPYVHRELLRAALGLKNKLPRDFSAVFHGVGVPLGHDYVPLRCADPAVEMLVSPHDYRGERYAIVPRAHFAADVVVKCGPPEGEKDRWGRRSKSSTHRVFVVCPHCKREIPAGRWHQHEGTAACAAN